MNARLPLLALAVLAAAAALAIWSRPTQAHIAPTPLDLQGAYDTAATDPGARHESGLKILGVDCAKADKGRYSCQVGFSKPDSEEGRVFLDVALVEPQTAGWKLLSGLCKRYN